MPERNITSGERQLIQQAHQLLPGGSTGNVYNDVIVGRGSGSHVWDISGNEYVDYLLGSGPLVLGHAHPEVVQAVQEQLENGTTFFATHESAIALAAEIVAASPCAEKIRYTSSGTEATEYALRAARATSGRSGNVSDRAHWSEKDASQEGASLFIRPVGVDFSACFLVSG